MYDGNYFSLLNEFSNKCRRWILIMPLNVNAHFPVLYFDKSRRKSADEEGVRPSEWEQISSLLQNG